MKTKPRKKVLLVSMPFGALERPALGLSLLKAKLTECAIPCDVRYLNVPLAEFIGAEEYQWINYELPYTAFAGDWTFTEALYGARPTVDAQYVQEVLRQTWHISEDDITRLYAVRQIIPTYLDYCLQSVPWQDYALVGFTSTFEQNLASLALARRLKELHPNLVIVFGGANWEAGMGRELHSQFPFVDFVCSGEAEESFPALVQTVMQAVRPKNDAQRLPALAELPGIVYRNDNGASVYTNAPTMIRNMDVLPYPDFTDFFAAHDASSACLNVMPSVLLETSRGCWWGAKSHCTFCGLNGGSLSYRSKSPQRTLDELEYLTDRWQTDHLEVVDNILDMGYFHNVLPALARARRAFHIFYEVKANLNRPQLALLRDAGVTRIQPGIESLNDHILQLMRKGTTALKNIQLLKWCQEYGIQADWNILYGFPGETPADYAQMLELLRAIRFLPAPTACGPIRLDRFSPYFNTPAEFGLTNVRPITTYQYLYPFPAASLQRLAYYFDYDYQDGAQPFRYAAPVIAYAAAWHAQPETGTLLLYQLNETSLRLLDTRSDAAWPDLTLTGMESATYEFCDEMHTCAAVTQHLQQRFAEQDITPTDVQAFLDSLVANRLMVTDGKYFLSLALRIHPPPPRHAAALTPRLPLRDYLPAILPVLASPVSVTNSLCQSGKAPQRQTHAVV